MRKKVDIFLDLERELLAINTYKGVFTFCINSSLLFSELERIKREIEKEIKDKTLKGEIKREIEKLKLALLLAQTG